MFRNALTRHWDTGDIKEDRRGYMDFEGIPFEVVRRRVKYSRVEFRSSGLRVIVPRGVSPTQVLKENRESILKKYNKLLGQLEDAAGLVMTERTDEAFIVLVNRLVTEYSLQLKIVIKKVRFRKMKRRWGTCRSDGVVTLNRYLQFVPDRLVGYIVYHELAHMLVRGHNTKFKKIVAAQFPTYRQLDRELNLYGLRLLS